MALLFVQSLGDVAVQFLHVHISLASPSPPPPPLQPPPAPRLPLACAPLEMKRKSNNISLSSFLSLSPVSSSYKGYFLIMKCDKQHQRNLVYNGMAEGQIDKSSRLQAREHSNSLLLLLPLSSPLLSPPLHLLSSCSLAFYFFPSI